MKNVSIILILAVLFSGFSFTSCGKYEEGPGVSVLPKTTRLQQKWRPVEHVSSSGVVTTIDKDGSYIEFVKGGEFKSYDGSFDIGISGTWEFNDDKSGVKVTYTAGSISTTSETKIVRLKLNSLGTEDEDGDKTYYEYF